MVDTYFRIAYPLTQIRVRGVSNGQDKIREVIERYGN